MNNNRMPHYELFMGTYYLKDGEEILYASDEIAIVFSKDSDMFTLHKHGSPELVEEWFNKTLKAYRDNGLSDIADQMYMLRGHFAVEDLNRILDTSGWIKYFLEKYVINLIEQPEK